MPKTMDTTKAEAIMDRFTNDPRLRKEILQHIQNTRDKKTSLDEIIAKYTKDPDLTAKIKERVSAMRRGDPTLHLTSLGADDANHAHGAAEAANQHRGAVDHIVTDGGKSRAKRPSGKGKKPSKRR